MFLFKLRLAHESYVRHINEDEKENVLDIVWRYKTTEYMASHLSQCRSTCNQSTAPNLGKNKLLVFVNAVVVVVV